MIKVQYKAKVTGVTFEDIIDFQPNSKLYPGVEQIKIEYVDKDKNESYIFITFHINISTIILEDYVYDILNIFTYTFGMLYNGFEKTLDERVLTSASITLYNLSEQYKLNRSDKMMLD